MVFKRRDKRPLAVALWEVLWPRGGWGRAFHYIRHRLNRLPDPPHRIARGVFAGVFVSFTPFFGLHLIVAAVLARMMRGNVLAALFATLVGNPFTFPFIAVLSIKLGNKILGLAHTPLHADGLLQTFAQAFDNLRHNLLAIFTHEPTQWGGMSDFLADIFLPYLVGGLAPGIAAGLLGYHIALPIVSAYQHRRRSRLKDRFAALRAKLPHRHAQPEAQADAPPPEDSNPA